MDKSIQLAELAIFAFLSILAGGSGTANFAGIQCGMQFDRDPKIVGGVTSFQHEFPWIVSLKSNGQHICGGSLIHSRYVMTSSQCVSLEQSSSLDVLQVTAGEHFLETKELPEDARNYEIEDVLIHPKYNSSTHENDIALIRLKRNIFINPTAWPACLVNSTKSFDGVEATVAGWGTTAERNYSAPNYENLSSSLQKVTVPIWKNAECQESFKKQNFSFQLVSVLDRP